MLRAFKDCNGRQRQTKNDSTNMFLRAEIFQNRYNTWMLNLQTPQTRPTYKWYTMTLGSLYYHIIPWVGHPCGSYKYSPCPCMLFLLALSFVKPCVGVQTFWCHNLCRFDTSSCTHAYMWPYAPSQCPKFSIYDTIGTPMHKGQYTASRVMVPSTHLG